MLTEDMTRNLIDARLGRSFSDLYPNADEFAGALGTMPTAKNKETWRKLFTEKRVDVYSDGAGTRILVCYSGSPWLSTSRPVGFYFSWIGIVPSDRLSEEKGSLSGKK